MYVLTTLERPDQYQHSGHKTGTCDSSQKASDRKKSTDNKETTTVNTTADKTTTTGRADTMGWDAQLQEMRQRNLAVTALKVESEGNYFVVNCVF